MPIRYRRGEQFVALWYAASHVSKATISCRFRIGHFSELLPGVSVVVGPRFPARLAAQVRTVVCIRPFVDEPMMDELAKLRARGIKLIADFDDLLFTGPPALFPSVVQGRGTVEHLTHRIGVYRRGLAFFDAFMVTTEPLAEHLRELRPDAEVRVVPNGLSRGWVQAGRQAARRYRHGDPRLIRYFAGSPTHDADLALVAKPLADFLARHRDVRLELAGFFDRIPEELPKGRLRVLPMRPYTMLPLLIAPSWVSIAPLAPTPFSQCKSDIKFLEAGAFGVPTLASEGRVYGRHQGSGLTACGNDEDWLDALEAMTHPVVRADASARAEAYVAKTGYADEHLTEWLAATLPMEAA